MVIKKTDKKSGKTVAAERQNRKGHDMAEGIRINKYLSEAGICSRRAADEYILKGRITINGKPAEMGQKIEANDRVMVDGKPVRKREETVILAYNKPLGLTCTASHDDPDNIFDHIKYPIRLQYVGRLDKDSQGLLLLTNDGDLSNSIQKSVNNHEKEYRVRVNKPITDEFLTQMAAGVPIKAPVAGISCGLITDDDGSFMTMVDIQGLEDFFGDMDFKVTGTTEGITAIQMDIKIHGLTRPIVEEAIRRTREARLFIMDTCMKPAIAEPRKTVGEYAPKIIQTSIDPAKIGEVVGQRGKTINAIIDECGVKIDITDDGFVSVCGVEQAGMDKAMKYIKTIVEDFEEGKIYEGKVVSIKEFGAFVEFAPGKEGMVHISKISNERINHVEDVLTLGDHVKCKCMGKDKMGRISFSIKDAM